MRPQGPISWCFWVSVVPNIIMEASGQLDRLRVGLWSNALGVNFDGDYAYIANVPTSSLKLKVLYIKYFFSYRIQYHELKF